jgi:hypothetical protein
MDSSPLSCISEDRMEEFYKGRRRAPAVPKRSEGMLNTAWMNGKNKISLIGS